LLEQLGLRFDIVRVDVAERRACLESPGDYVIRVAREKALAGFAAVRRKPDAVVLGADTEVVLDGRVFGKPRDSGHAAQMLQRLSGREHRVMSGVCCVAADRAEHVLNISRVQFARLSDAQVQTYVAAGECMGKAGAYAIQGRAAAFITNLQGSYSGVMGLPLHETAQLLAKFGEYR